MTVLLGVALFGPAVLLALDRDRARLGSLVPAALWLVVALVDADATLSRFGAGAAPVGVGTWLLVSSVAWPRQRLVAAITTIAAAVAVGGASLLSGTGEVADAVGGLAIAAAALVVAARAEADGALVPAVGAVLGVAAMAVGVASDGDGWVLLGAAAAVVAAGGRARRSGVVLLPATLLVASTAPTFDWGHAVLLGVVATALAGRPAVTAGLWTLAVTAFGVPPLLLGAPAVLLAVTLHPAVALAAAPGAAVAIPALADAGSRWAFVLAVLAALTALRLWRPPVGAVPGRVAPAGVAGFAVAGWLLVAPETWTDVAALDRWGTGVLVAVVAAVAGAFVVASFADVALAVPDLEVADPPYRAGEDPGWAWPAAVGSLVILAVAGGALVASTVS